VGGNTVGRLHRRQGGHVAADRIAACWSVNFNRTSLFIHKGKDKGKGKAVPLQAWGGPEGSRKLRFPDFMTMAQDGDKVVSLTHRPLYPPGNTPGAHFC
jgi:hypothetical protein